MDQLDRWRDRPTKEQTGDAKSDAVYRLTIYMCTTIHWGDEDDGGGGCYCQLMYYVVYVDQR